MNEKNKQIDFGGRFFLYFNNAMLSLASILNVDSLAHTDNAFIDESDMSVGTSWSSAVYQYSIFNHWWEHIFFPLNETRKIVFFRTIQCLSAADTENQFNSSLYYDDLSMTFCRDMNLMISDEEETPLFEFSICRVRLGEKNCERFDRKRLVDDLRSISWDLNFLIWRHRPRAWAYSHYFRSEMRWCQLSDDYVPQWLEIHPRPWVTFQNDCCNDRTKLILNDHQNISV